MASRRSRLARIRTRWQGPTQWNLRGPKEIMTIITGLGLVLLGACVGIGGRAAGVAWGSRRQCLTAWAIRGLCGLLIYWLAGYWTARGFASLASAQTFPRDSQTIITGRQALVPSPSLDDYRQREITKLLDHMYDQDVLNSQIAGRLNGHDDRLKSIESIKPDTVALRLDGLESSMKSVIALLVTIFCALALNLWSSWTKRPKGSEGS